MGGISYCHWGNNYEKREEKQEKNVKKKEERETKMKKWEVKGSNKCKMGKNKSGVYILENTSPPGGGGGNISRCHLREKNMKR
jgi:hypothetical protein